MLLRFQKAAVRGNYETGNQAFSMHLRFLTIRGRRSWRSSFLGDPGSKFFYEKLGKAGRKKKEQGKKKRRKEEKKREGIQTAELDRRDQVTATKSRPNFPSREGSRGR